MTLEPQDPKSASESPAGDQPTGKLKKAKRLTIKTATPLKQAKPLAKPAPAPITKVTQTESPDPLKPTAPIKPVAPIRLSDSEKAKKRPADRKLPDDDKPFVVVDPSPAKSAATDDADESTSAHRSNKDYVAWLASTLIHMVLIIALGLWVIKEVGSNDQIFVTVSEPVVEEELEEEEIESPEFEPTEIVEQTETEVPIEEPLEVDTPNEVADSPPIETFEEFKTSNLLAANDWMSELPIRDRATVPVQPAGGQGDTPSGSGDGEGDGTDGDSSLGGRAARRQALRADGGNPEKEQAVNKGLTWLLKHQLPDGGWSYEHRSAADCQGKCANPGSLRNARYAATGMALLPLLGAGYTHEQGPYRKQIAAGLHYLLRHMAADGNLWDKEGTMYGHGLATLALCEAYGMSKLMPAESWSDLAEDEDGNKILIDRKKLGRAAEMAASYIEGAQGPDGGWRYRPRQLGDTSVMGWQIMALKSAKDADLTFNPTTRKGAIVYLNRVQTDMVGDKIYGLVGTRYSYDGSRKQFTDSTSAIGILCRIYMGLSPEHPAVQMVVKRLDEKGPNPSDLYFSYYANQIIYQFGGAEWERWNASLSNSLTGSQVKNGHQEGSWFFQGGDHGASSGGRLYCTSLALLCLEEHYRHMRMFQDAVANEQANKIPDQQPNEEAPAEDPAGAEAPAVDEKKDANQS